MNHHHGMQAVERFGVGIDADLDGIADELTVGDVTAVTVFQAALPSPGLSRRLVPERRAAAARGAQTFRAVGCGDCHRPVLVLDSTVFSEPNPYNPPGNLRLVDVPRPFTFDLAKWAAGPGLTRLPGGGARVHAYSDLKRHDLTDEDYPHFGNEQLHQGTLAGFADPGSFTVAPPPRPLGAFLTSRLWDAGDSDPYGHRGDLTTLTDAIHFHGGEARDSRNAFFGLPEREREDLIEFLKAQRVPSR
jgi:cytochrome c peroxidase